MQRYAEPPGDGGMGLVGGKGLEGKEYLGDWAGNEGGEWKLEGNTLHAGSPKGF